MNEHDPGGKVRLKLAEGVLGGGLFSKCRRYRHTLWRSLGGDEDAPFALWIGMNPSVADASTDDPTVRREWIYTRSQLGLSHMIKCNVMDYRCTDPKKLPLLDVPPCSPSNLPVIRAYALSAKVVILAYGTLPKALKPFALAVTDMLREIGRPAFCLGVTADSSPRHPLYVRGDTPLVSFGLPAPVEGKATLANPVPFCSPAT